MIVLHHAQSSQKKFKCDTCQRYFNRREHLQRHESIHYNLKPFHCDLCRYSCRRRDLLNRHIKLAHTNKDSPENDGNPAPSTDGKQGPSYGRGPSPDDELRSSSGILSAGVGPGPRSASDHDPSLVGDALATPTVFSQPGLSSMSPYLNGAGPAFMDPERTPQPFGLNYLDSVCLPPLNNNPSTRSFQS